MDCSIIPYLILLVFVLVFYICTCKNALTESFAPKQSCSDLSYISNCSDASSSGCEDHWSYVPNWVRRSKGKPMRCNYSGSTGCGFKLNSDEDRVNDNWLCKETPSDSPDEECQDNRANNNGQTGACTYDTVCRDSRANNKKDTNWPGGTDNNKCTYDTVCKDSRANDKKDTNWPGGTDNNKCTYDPVCREEDEPDAINSVTGWPKRAHAASECQFETKGCKDPIAKNYKSTYDIHKQKECEYHSNTRVCRDPDATNYGYVVGGPSSIRGRRFKNADECHGLDAIIKSKGGRNDKPYEDYPRCHTSKDGRWVTNSKNSDGESSGTEANLCREKYCFEWERIKHDGSKCQYKGCKDKDANNYESSNQYIAGGTCTYDKSCKNDKAENYEPQDKFPGGGDCDFAKKCVKSQSMKNGKYAANAVQDWPIQAHAASECKYKGCTDTDANNHGNYDISDLEDCQYPKKCKNPKSLEFNTKWLDDKYEEDNTLCNYDRDGPTFELNDGNKHPTTGREYITLNGKWNDPGYTNLSDEHDDSPRVTVKDREFLTNEVTNIDAPKVVTYVAKDKYENTTTITREVDILDLIAPEIKLKPHISGGVAEVKLTIGEQWQDPGVEVSDNYYNDLTYQAIVTGDGNYINTTLPGKYTITYNASDGAWPKPNSAIPVERTVVVEDTKAPDILLAGENPHYVDAQAGLYYENIDPGIEKVLDDVDNVSNDKVAIVSSSQINSQGKAIEIDKNGINLSKPGNYEIIYEVKDSAGNTGSAKREVIVSDNQPPTIDLINGNVIELAIGDNYKEYGAIVEDNIDSDLKAKITGADKINTNKEGTYDVFYSARDNAGNSTETPARRQVVVKDKTGPSIQLNGPADMKVRQGSRYIEEGAKANDNIDGPVVPIIEVTPGGEVNTNRRGKYTVTYYAKDKAGNPSGEIERIVHVVDKTPPHITFKNPPGWKEDKPYPGENGLDWGSTYTEYYAALRDDDGKVYDLDDKVKIRIKSPKGKWVSKIDTKIEGVWTVLYNGKDAGDNKSKTIRRKVLILPEPDKIPPQLALNNPIYPGESGIEVGVAGRDDNKYIEYGARALDDDGTVLDPSTVKIKVNGIEGGVVDTNTVGQYNVEYDVKDLAGNPAQTITRVVYVVDTTKPTITLNGENPMLIDHSSKYEEPGAKAFDNGVDISEHIKIDGRVNVTNEREYIIRYSITDENGLTTSKSRIVNVIDRFRVLCKEPVFRNLKCDELERNICEGNRVSAQYDGEPYHCIFKDGLCQKGLKCGTRPKQGDEIWLQRLAHKFNNDKI